MVTAGCSGLRPRYFVCFRVSVKVIVRVRDRVGFKG